MTNRLRTKGTSGGLSIPGLKSGVFWPSALPTEIKTTGKAQLSDQARGSLQFFDQRRQTPISWVVSEDHVAVEIDYWCRLAKDLGGKKAGEEMMLRGASFFEIKGGLICKLTDYM